MFMLGSFFNEDSEARDRHIRMAYPYRYRYVVLSLIMVVAASLLVLIAILNVRHTSLFMLGLGLWFLAISGLRMSVLAFRHGQRLNMQHREQVTAAASAAAHVMQIMHNENMHNYIHRQWHIQNSDTCEHILTGPHAFDHMVVAPPPKYDDCVTPTVTNETTSTATSPSGIATSPPVTVSSTDEPPPPYESDVDSTRTSPVREVV